MKYSIVGEWIETAKNNNPVWIGDVRESFAGIPDCFPVSMLITLLDGTEKEFNCPVPD